MKKIISIASMIAIALLITSCSSEKTLQKYLVESQDRQGFINADIPGSILQLRTEEVSEDVKNTLKSIRKVNIVALPVKGNEESYEKEKMRLNKIFERPDYKNLMSMKAKGMKVKIYYKGDAESIDEVIAFGYGKDAGVGVARLIGKDMNPAKIVEMMNNIKIDGKNNNLRQFDAIFQF